MGVKPWGSPELLLPLVLRLPHDLPHLPHLSWLGELSSLLWGCSYPKDWLQLQLWTWLQLPVENTGQGLNFLPAVTFAQEEEKVEEASQEVTQQRFDTRPAPASPEKQVLVRQEESSATATNRVRGSPKVPTGSVQESQPVFVLRPFINAKVSPHLTSLQTRKSPTSLSYSDRQSGVLLI